jgi:lipopolysaccharide transport system ATP-binding protein
MEEIIEFSGLARFADTPIKRYSSGMSVRLAFAVMAHLEPEILVVDEVLAVGDAEFQRKCLNKMDSASKGGRTVLFVSHNMAAVTRLCDRGLYVRQGSLIQDGTAADVAHSYITQGGDNPSAREWQDINSAPGDDTVRLRSVRVVSEKGTPVGSVDAEQKIGIQITFDVLEPGHLLSPYFTIVSDTGIDLFTVFEGNKEAENIPREPGRYVTVGWIPGHFLSEGTHYVRVVMRATNRCLLVFTERDVAAFNVVDKERGGLGSSWWEGKPSGVVRPLLKWTGEYIEPDMVLDNK